MSRQINISKVNGSTIFEVTQDGITSVTAYNVDANIFAVGRKINVSDGCKIICSFLFSEVQDKLGAVNANDYVEKMTERGYFSISDSDSSVMLKEVIEDGIFSAIKGDNTTDPENYRFRLENVSDEFLQWVIGSDSFNYGATEWSLEVDKLGQDIPKRIDAVSYGNDGDIHYFKGNETEASYPSVPENHIMKTFVLITADGVEVLGGSNTVEKDNFAWRSSIVHTSTIWYINGYFSRKIDRKEGNNNLQQRLQAFHIDQTKVYSGVVFSIWNVLDESVLIPNLFYDSDSHYTSFSFPDGQDYYVQPNELVTFIYNKADNVLVFRSSNKKVKIGGDLGGTITEPKVVKISLIAEPGKTVVVTVLPNGDVQAEEIQELWVYDDTITGYTLSDLQTEYPTSGGHEQGFEVRCRNMTPPTVYRKDSENDSIWTKIELENVT